MNIFFIKVRFFSQLKKNASAGPTALERGGGGGHIFEIMGQWPGPTINLKPW